MKADARRAARPPVLPRSEKPPFLSDDAPTDSEKGSDQNVGQNRSVLVVDDNDLVLKAFEPKLKGSGFAITTTPNAAAVARSAHTVRTELIILDVIFSSSSGLDWSDFTVMQWLRRLLELGQIPVILDFGGRGRQTPGEGIGERRSGFLSGTYELPGTPGRYAARPGSEGEDSRLTLFAVPRRFS